MQRTRHEQAAVPIHGNPRDLISTLELRAFRPGPRAEVDIYLECSKGTYVRSLAEDLGRALGVGGHVRALRRTKAGPFGIGDSVTLSTLEGLKRI